MLIVCGDPLFLMLNNIAVTLLIGPNRYYDVDLKSINWAAGCSSAPQIPSIQKKSLSRSHCDFCNMTDNQLLYCQRFLLLPSHCSSGGRGGVALTSHQVLSATAASSVLHATPLADTNYVQGNQRRLDTLCAALMCLSFFLYNSFFIWFLLLDGIWLKFGSKLIGLAWGRIISSNMWF